MVLVPVWRASQIIIIISRLTTLGDVPTWSWTFWTCPSCPCLFVHCALLYLYGTLHLLWNKGGVLKLKSRLCGGGRLPFNGVYFFITPSRVFLCPPPQSYLKNKPSWNVWVFFWWLPLPQTYLGGGGGANPLPGHLVLVTSHFSATPTS